MDRQKINILKEILVEVSVHFEGAEKFNKERLEEKCRKNIYTENLVKKYLWKR